jgi:hypothetical protein
MTMMLLLVSSSFAAVNIASLIPAQDGYGCSSSSQCLSGSCSSVSNTCVEVSDQWFGVGGNEYRSSSVSREYSGQYNLTHTGNLSTSDFSSIVQGSDYLQPKVVDMDADGRNELLIVSGSVISLYRYTGSDLLLVASESLNASPTRDGYVDRLISSEPTGRTQFIIGSGTQYLIYGFDGGDIYLIKQTTSSALTPQISDIICTTDIYASMYYYCAWIEGSDGIRIWQTDANPTFGTYNLSVARGAATTVGIQEPNERKLYFIDPDNNGNLRLYIPNFQRRIIYSMFVTTNQTDNAFGTSGALTFPLSFWTSDASNDITTDVPNSRVNYLYLVSRLYTNPTNGQYFCGNFHHFRTTGDNKQYGVINCVNKLGVSVLGYNFQIDTVARSEYPLAFVQVEGWNVTQSGGMLNYPVLCSLFPYLSSVYMTCYSANSINVSPTLVLPQQFLGTNTNRGFAPSTLGSGVAIHINRGDNYPSIFYRDSIYRINTIAPTAGNVSVYNQVYASNRSTYGYVFGDLVAGDSVEYIAYKNNSLIIGRALFENVSASAPYIDTNISPNVTFGGVFGYNLNLCVGGTQNFTMRECGNGQSSNCSYVNTIGFTERLIIQSGNTIGVYHNNTPTVSRTYTSVGSYEERIILQSYDSPNSYDQYVDIAFNVSSTNCSLPILDITQPPTGALPTVPPTVVTPPTTGTDDICTNSFLVLYCLDDVSLSSRVGFAVLIAILANVLVTVVVMHFGQSPSPMLYGWVTMLLFIAAIGGGLLPLYFGGVAILLIVGTIALFALASPRN